jgi:glycosyltransferase involved in cell wall biosynthesis
MKLEKASNILVSFIIPAYNEEQNLPKTLSSIKTNLEELGYETIVVDNGSTDSTAEVAERHGAVVLKAPEKTIGGLRNLGATEASGKFLVFLDSDVTLTRGWTEEFVKSISSTEADERLITGSRCGVSSSENWIEKYWFAPMLQEIPNYMNSGHLILRRNLFKDLGGFNEELITGEDWEFSRRARKQGVKIVNNPELRVVHDGYPKNLMQFLQRESWHGLQDFCDFESFRTSKVALVAIGYWIIWLAGILASVHFRSISYFVLSFIANSLLCLAATLAKGNKFDFSILPRYLLFHIYFFARGLSLGKALLRKNAKATR